MPKTRKNITNSYLDYEFSPEEYCDDPPEWYGDLEICLAIPAEFSQGDGTVLQPLVYTFYDKDKHPLYVGKSKRFWDRLAWHERAKDNKEPWMYNVEYVGLICLETLEEMDVVEVLESHKKLAKYSPDLKHDGENYTTPLFGHKAFDITTYYEEDVFPYSKLWD